MGLSSKRNPNNVRKQVLDAAKTGSLLLIDELNTNPGLIEDILDDLMSSASTGKNQAIHPSFRIIATQNNAARLNNRQDLPESLRSRFYCRLLPAANDDTLRCIVSGLVPDPNIQNYWIQAYKTLRTEHMALTPRGLRQCIKETGPEEPLQTNRDELNPADTGEEEEWPMP